MDKGFLLYLVGISGSGKTTIANRLKKLITPAAKKPLQVIDGDEIRSQFGDIFGYTFDERMKCTRAVCVVARYLVDNGINVVLTQVGAYKEMREMVRRQFKNKYAEVYVKCSLEECMRRDVKGYYAKRIDGLNGLSDLFEVPEYSEVVVDTEKEGVEKCCKRILEYLEEKRYDI